MFLKHRGGMELPSFIMIILVVGVAAVAVMTRLLTTNKRAANAGNAALNRFPVFPP